jgi:hypothetical protein
MTDKEIADRVESWNWNLSIFEIYDEVKDMGKFGYGGGQTEELSRLLNHAYYYFNEDKIKKVVIDGVSHGATPMIGELASFLGVDIIDKEEVKSIPISDEGIRLDGEKGLTEAS